MNQRSDGADSWVRLLVHGSCPATGDLPVPPLQDFEGRLEPLRAKASVVEQFLLSNGGFVRNGPPVAGTQFYRWSRPDEGILYVAVHETSVHVDTHAHWNAVLNLYELLRLIEPELLIVDNQTAMLYDAESYRTFVDESYARKT